MDRYVTKPRKYFKPCRRISTGSTGGTCEYVSALKITDLRVHASKWIPARVRGYKDKRGANTLNVKSNSKCWHWVKTGHQAPLPSILYLRIFWSIRDNPSLSLNSLETALIFRELFLVSVLVLNWSFPYGTHLDWLQKWTRYFRTSPMHKKQFVVVINIQFWNFILYTLQD